MLEGASVADAGRFVMPDEPQHDLNAVTPDDPPGEFELPDDFEEQVARLGHDDEPVPPLDSSLNAAIDAALPAPPVVGPDDWQVTTSPQRVEPAEPAGSHVPAFVVRLLGHVVFSLLGLVIGYYILCWLEPRGNFLHLNLPGIQAPPSLPGAGR